ncbi:MAG: hypothetical protein HQK73_03585, partial [Desulfamplus sp.]|nr:hypothetical protein [Desulfamplus sp.]
LIGGKIVVLLECQSQCDNAPNSILSNTPHHNHTITATSHHRIISVCPARHTKVVDTPELQQLAEFSHRIKKAEIWSPTEGEPHIQEILKKKQWGVSVVMPLNLGAKRFGLLLVINLLNTHRLEEIIQTLEMMPNIIALVLKNSLIYEDLENMVKIRTSELESRTEELAARTQELTNLTEELAKTNEELEQLNNELEERVKQRTAQLEASNKELKIANRELEAFCYSVSHDLRTPLRGIDGWSFVLAEEFDDVIGETGKQYIEKIRLETERMSELIDDLLNLSRITKTELVITPINISTLTASVVERLKERYSERKVEVAIQPELTAYGDIRMLDIVLTNLIENAFKFTSKTPVPKIEFGKIENLRLESRNRQIFYVKDNGAGFDMAYSAKLFGAFQRLHKISEFSGNGVGLATVDRIIQRHGGRVWAEGVVNQGATFYFSL